MVKLGRGKLQHVAALDGAVLISIVLQSEVHGGARAARVGIGIQSNMGWMLR
jgi:hypothetical protein